MSGRVHFLRTFGLCVATITKIPIFDFNTASQFFQGTKIEITAEYNIFDARVIFSQVFITFCPLELCQAEFTFYVPLDRVLHITKVPICDFNTASQFFQGTKIEITAEYNIFDARVKFCQVFITFSPLELCQASSLFTYLGPCVATITKVPTLTL